MPYRVLRRQGRKANSWRVPIQQYSAFGMGSCEHVDVLKAHVTDAGLKAPGEKLDVVVIEDMEHFYDLMNDGIPMARAYDSPDAPGGKDYVRIRKPYYIALWLGVAFMPSAWMWPTRIQQLADLLGGGLR